MVDRWLDMPLIVMFRKRLKAIVVGVLVIGSADCAYSAYRIIGNLKKLAVVLSERDEVFKPMLFISLSDIMFIMLKLFILLTILFIACVALIISQEKVRKNEPSGSAIKTTGASRTT